MADKVKQTLIVAVWDVLSAASAKAAGVTHGLLSGAAFANVHGYPDRGVTDLRELTLCAKQIVEATGLKLMVDIDGGLGSVPRMSRLIDELLIAGIDSVHVQDVDEGGQSKHSEHRSQHMAGEPSLSEPEELAHRIELIRQWAGGGLKILARTDFLPNGDFDDSLRRLKMYDESGADWLMPVFVPSLDDLKRTTALFPDRTASIIVSAPTGYTPSIADAAEAGVWGTFVTGQYRNVFSDLRDVYRRCLEGDDEGVFAERISGRELEEWLGLHRPGMDL